MIKNIENSLYLRETSDTRMLPRTVLKTYRYIRQDATLQQLEIIERELLRIIKYRRRQLSKVDLYA